MAGQPQPPPLPPGIPPELRQTIVAIYEWVRRLTGRNLSEDQIISLVRLHGVGTTETTTVTTTTGSRVFVAVVPAGESPSDSVGEDGDSYISALDSRWWTKRGGKWRFQGLLGNAVAPTGTEIRTGTGDPTATDAARGTLYIDRSTGRLWQYEDTTPDAASETPAWVYQQFDLIEESTNTLYVSASANAPPASHPDPMESYDDHDGWVSTATGVWWRRYDGAWNRAGRLLGEVATLHVTLFAYRAVMGSVGSNMMPDRPTGGSYDFARGLYAPPAGWVADLAPEFDPSTHVAYVSFNTASAPLGGKWTGPDASATGSTRWSEPRLRGLPFATRRIYMISDTMPGALANTAVNDPIPSGWSETPGVAPPEWDVSPSGALSPRATAAIQYYSDGELRLVEERQTPADQRMYWDWTDPAPIGLLGMPDVGSSALFPSTSWSATHDAATARTSWAYVLTADTFVLTTTQARNIDPATGRSLVVHNNATFAVFPITAVSRSGSTLTVTVGDPTKTSAMSDYELASTSDMVFAVTLQVIAGNAWSTGSGPPTGAGTEGQFYLDVAGRTLHQYRMGMWRSLVDLSTADVATWHQSDRDPNEAPAIAGNDGDFLFRTDTATIYNRVQGVWIEGATLDGDDGVDGNRWHSGTGPPAASLGDADDFYFQTDNGFVHQKRGDPAVWVFLRDITPEPPSTTLRLFQAMKGRRTAPVLSVPAAAEYDQTTGTVSSIGSWTQDEVPFHVTETMGSDVLNAAAEGDAGAIAFDPLRMVVMLTTARVRASGTIADTEWSDIRAYEPYRDETTLYLRSATRPLPPADEDAWGD